MKKYWKHLIAVTLIIAMGICLLPAEIQAESNKEKLYSNEMVWDGDGIVSAGRAFHLLNNDMKGNKIRAYELYIKPVEGTNAVFDVAVLNRKGQVNICRSSKTFRSGRLTGYMRKENENCSLMGCVQVRRGKVFLAIRILTAKPNVQTMFWREYQKADHHPFSKVTKEKGRGRIRFNKFRKKTKDAILYYDEGKRGRRSITKCRHRMVLRREKSEWIHAKRDSKTFYFPTDLVSYGHRSH